MRTYLAAVLGELSPRRMPRAAVTQKAFRLFPAVQELRAAAVSADGSVWIATDKGLLDVARGRLLGLPAAEDPTGAGLTRVAAGRFLVAGGPAGIYVLAGQRLDPVEPRSPAVALACHEDLAVAVTREASGRYLLRRAASPQGRWVARFETADEPAAVAFLAGGDVLLGGRALTRVRPRGRGTSVALPEGVGRVLDLAARGDQVLLSGDDGGVWLGAAPGFAWRRVGEGVPGAFGAELAWAAAEGVYRLGAETARAAPPAADPAVPARPVDGGGDGTSPGFWLGPRQLWRAGPRKWKSVAQAGRQPGRATAFRSTRSGALWALDEAGRLYHFTPPGDWTLVEIEGGARVAPGLLGADGEAALVRTPGAEGGLSWVAPPRGAEVGQVATRRPRELSLGPLSGRPVTAACGLGGVVYAGVGERVARIDGERVDVWGRDEGVPAAPVVALEPMFDDLWLIAEGDAGPRRFGQATPGPEPIPGSGPAGRAVSLTADEDSGQLWVGFDDGERGGVASVSREGRWVTQLRLGAAARGVAAAAGTVLASGDRGLYLLEEGERKRRLFGPEDGLPPARLGALGFAGSVVLVDTEQGLYWSDPELWKPPETAENLQV